MTAKSRLLWGMNDSVWEFSSMRRSSLPVSAFAFVRTEATHVILSSLLRRLGCLFLVGGTQCKQIRWAHWDEPQIPVLQLL